MLHPPRYHGTVRAEARNHPHQREADYRQDVEWRAGKGRVGVEEEAAIGLCGFVDPGTCGWVGGYESRCW